MGIKRIYNTIIFIAAACACVWAGKSTDSLVVTGGANLNRVTIDSLKSVGRIDTAKASALDADRLYYDGIYGDIHNHDTVTTQSIATGGTYTKLTCFPSNGPCNLVTCDTANDKLIILRTGKYRVNLSASFGGSASSTWRATVFLGGAEQESIHFARKLGATGDIGSASASGIINVTSVPADLDVRARHDQGGNQNFTAWYANLSIAYIGR